MKRIDPITLDRLVTGRHDGEDAEAWEALVTQPGGAAAWSAAQDRRAVIDRQAALILGRPWLASALLAVRRLGRRLSERGTSLTATVTAPPLAAVLGPAAEVGRPITVAWGEVRTVELCLGEVVAFAPASGVLAWRTPSAEGILAQAGWRMEAGDSPTLILVIEGPDAGTITARLATAVRVGGILLVEAEIGETTA